MAWCELLTRELEKQGESFKDIISWTGVLDGFFIAWTAKRVYFSIEYISIKFVQSVPRNPDS